MFEEWFGLMNGIVSVPIGSSVSGSKRGRTKGAQPEVFIRGTSDGGA